MAFKMKGWSPFSQKITEQRTNEGFDPIETDKMVEEGTIEKQKDYWYKIENPEIEGRNNVKMISKEEYIKHQNDPSGWTKSTNDPNPYDK